jgi:hypothetical protein
VSLLIIYPILFALAGFVGSALLSARALALMSADDKAALVDASSRTRLLTVLAVAIFLLLMFWRPLYGWVFLGFAYLGLGIRSIFRLRGLALPPKAARLILIGNACSVTGIALCAFIFAIRALQ